MIINCSHSIYSQKRNGEAIYKVNFDMSLFNKKHESRKMDELRRKLLKETKEVTALLRFSSSESLYFLERDMLKENKGGINLSFSSGGGNNKYYYNAFSNENIIQDCELLGECFRIKKTSINWNITQKTKIVNGQLCYLATTNEVVNNKTVNIFAWFNPKIPINYGPKNYNGLPGLIFELITHNTVFKLHKLKYNNKNGNKFMLKGRLVSEDEFKNLCKKIFPKEIFRN